KVATRRELDVALGLEFGQAAPESTRSRVCFDAPSLVGVERHGMPGYLCLPHEPFPAPPRSAVSSLAGAGSTHPSGEFWPHPADRRPGGETSPELGFPPVLAVWRRPQVGPNLSGQAGPVVAGKDSRLDHDSGSTPRSRSVSA